MDSIYLISLIVGGFFVLLSVFGGGDHESDLDAEVDMDGDLDFDGDAEFDHDLSGDHEVDGDFGSGIGIVDLLSIRALFLFGAFFGLTGTSLTFLGEREPLTGILSTLVGLAVGLGGNYVIKRFAYEEVSSMVGAADYAGTTGRVLLPFEGSERGKIALEIKGQRLQLLAQSLDGERIEEFAPGEEVVVVRMKGRVAEVVKPD